MSNSDKDTMRDEYDISSLGKPVRGKYAARYKKGTNVVVIEPDLAEKFPTTEAVNKALRDLLKEENHGAT
ncbi:MAG: hypothetical protein JJ957_20000 [Pseudomonadales bacterium]|nr:hypothetical protein [Pseudomonadales bacterium]